MSDDFVRDYAAKRQAQMERARALREMRQATANHTVNSPSSQQAGQNRIIGNPFDNAQQQHHDAQKPSLPPSAVRQSVPQQQQPQHRPSTYSVGGATSDSIMVAEKDFMKAARLGIISDDQASKLWSALASGGAPGNGHPRASVDRPLTQQPPTVVPQQQPQYKYSPSNYSTTQQQQQPQMSNMPPAQQQQPTHQFTMRPSGNKPEWNSDSTPSKSSYNNGGIQPNESDDFEYNVPPPPKQGVSSATRASKSQLEAKPVVSNKGFDLTTDDQGDGTFGAPPPVPGRRQAKPQAKPQPNDAGGPAVAGRRAGQQQQQPPRSTYSQPVVEAPVETQDEVSEFERQKREAVLRFEQEVAQAQNAASSERLVPCSICGRTFREGIIDRHETACMVAHKKRKAFDTAGQRAEGIEGMEEVKRQQSRQGRGGAKKQPAAATAAMPAGGKPKWKAQHEQLQAAMAAMRQYKGEQSGVVSGGGGRAAPPVEAYDDRVPCPHCGRKFNEVAAERHIPKCKSIIAKPKMLCRR